MIFDYRTLFRQLRLSLFFTRKTHFRLTSRRIRVLIVFGLLFTWCEIANWIGLTLDRIFYRNFRDIDLAGKTLFIVGNFRSGSTFLHRLLAADRSTFTALNAWEIYLAPSIIQRKILRGLKIVDSWFGSPILTGLRAWDKRFLQSIPLHSISLWKAEEDVGLLFTYWYSFLSWFFFPDEKAIDDLIYFDDRISPRRRMRIVRLYADCLKRHLYTHGRSRIVVSKNPSFSPAIASLCDGIPDARFIALVRHPLDTVSSTLGWFSYAWGFFAEPLEKFPFVRKIVEMIEHWYICVERAKRELSDAALIVTKFDSFVETPAATVGMMYERLGLPLAGEQRIWLEREEEVARNHQPDRTSRLATAGIDQRWLVELFDETINHYWSASDAGILKIRAVDKT